MKCYDHYRRPLSLLGDKKGIYNDGYDDDSGNYIVQIGEEIGGRYIVQDVLGIFNDPILHFLHVVHSWFRGHGMACASQAREVLVLW